MVVKGEMAAGIGVLGLVIGIAAAGDLTCGPAEQARAAELEACEERCASRLGSLYEATRIYREEFGRLPFGGGRSLGEELRRAVAFEDELLGCPGGLYAFRSAPVPEPADPDLVLAACANALQGNHGDRTHVLRADGRVETLSLADLVRRGRVPPGTHLLIVGPGSPLPELRALQPE